MDVNTEEKIINNLLSIKDLTIIFVTHRINAIKNFDEIIMIENGSIKDINTFKKFLNQISEINMKNSHGKVFWITGLSGSGKTTLGKLLYKSIKEDENNTIHLDGDELREILNFEKQYDIKSRKNIAKIYSKICKKISEQNINVIISTISCFIVLEIGIKNIKNYIEVYIKVSKQKLYDRDDKNIYKSFSEGKIKDVVGMDISFEEPKNPDIIIYDESLNSINNCIEKIKKLANKKLCQ